MKHKIQLPAPFRPEKKNMSAAATAWAVFGGLVVLGGLVMVIKEIPAIRRELHLLRM